MSRRVSYAFGKLLDLDPKGMITCGIAIGGGTGFTVSYISPTDLITETGTRRDIAGPKAALVGAVLQPAAAGQLAQAGKITLDGDESLLATFAAPMDEFDPNFNIVTP